MAYNSRLKVTHAGGLASASAPKEHLRFHWISYTAAVFVQCRLRLTVSDHPLRSKKIHIGPSSSCIALELHTNKKAFV